jgi:hypothetical protein
MGRELVVERCVRLLGGGEVDEPFLFVLGGDPARALAARGMPPGEAYWLRVWAARGLLWAGPGDEVDQLRASLADDAWRVREMICKVVARHLVADLLDDVARLDADPVPRVRAAAQRAVIRLVDEGT